MEDLRKSLKTTSKYVSILQANGIGTIQDLLAYFPRTYEDRSTITPLADLFFTNQETQIVTVKGQVISKKMTKRGNKLLREIIIQDQDHHQATLFFSKKAYQVRAVKKDQYYTVIGRPQYKYETLTFRYPEMVESTDGGTDNQHRQTGRIYPIYPEMMGIKPQRFAKKMRALTQSNQSMILDDIPHKALEIFQLMDLHKAYQQIHFPESRKDLENAQQRIFFDRLLKVQLKAKLFKNDYIQNAEHKDDVIQIQKIKTSKKKPVSQLLLKKIDTQNTKSKTKDKGYSLQPQRSTVRDFTQTLPFDLTNAQKRVIKEMIEDLHLPKPMLRLLQGDVGSGKTVVSATIAYYAIKVLHGQVAFLAPLSILAQQHYQTLAKLLLPLGIRIEYIAGSLTTKQKQKLKAGLKQGGIDIIVGTHALIQDDVHFDHLRLAIVDEQHKFGVRQRAFFKKRGAPHIIQMSATPIPRSLALAFFGEFDVSIIDELPAGRKPIHTKIISEKQYKKLKPRFLAKIQEGQKMFVVTPLIEESEKMENLKAATTEREKICDFFPELKGQIGLLHGKIKAKEKDQIMQAFKDGKYKILVATTVIEVGVDIKQATMMIIKNAERFGLSQLHQLRGRIGRNDIQSYCFLETTSRGGDTYKRLKAMEQHTDGFKLAEIDLQYRGSGEMLGTRQSGESDIPLQLLTNLEFINKVRQASEWILDHYPNLEGLESLQEKVLGQKDVLIA